MYAKNFKSDVYASPSLSRILAMHTIPSVLMEIERGSSSDSGFGEANIDLDMKWSQETEVEYSTLSMLSRNHPLIMVSLNL